jgi:ankyrin repeat protein
MSAVRNAGDGDDAQSIRKVESLLDAGASPSAPDESGAALVYAISRDRSAIAKLLRERGAKVDWSRLPEGLQLQPFRLSYGSWFERKPDRLRELESLGMPLDPFGAAILGREDRLRELLADPKWKPTAISSTTVYFAADQGQTACLRLLLDAGGDPNERIPSWDTPDIGPRPLDGAALNGHTETVQLLLQRGADPKLMTLEDDQWHKVNQDIRQILGRK